MGVAALAVAACSTVDVSSPSPGEGETAQDVVVTTCTQPMPTVPINFDREMVIRDQYVVEDGVAGDGSDDVNDNCRTSWTGCSASMLPNQGHWTFGYMMAAMAGTSDPNSPVAKSFAWNWLKMWLAPQQPNPAKTAAAPRTAIMENLIRPWLDVSKCPSTATPDTLATCTLDLKQAPFRLLAFVNRIDLPSVVGYTAGGEFRVVFGAIGREPVAHSGDPSNQTLNATVILEYTLPIVPGSATIPQSLLTWGTSLHELSSYDPEDLTQTLTYRSKLQAITDAIVGPNAFPPGPNHSAISHVRTNEIAFDCNRGSLCNGVAPNPSLAQWEMRQFKLNGAGGTTGVFLVQDTVAQTPQSSDNNSAAINNQLTTNQTAIFNGDPAFGDNPTDNALLGNASQSPGGTTAIVWEKNWLPTTPSQTQAQARSQFGFGTCNGCHYAETANQQGLFHIYPRDAGSESGISAFLSTNGAPDPIAPKVGTSNQAPKYTETVGDAANTGFSFSYSEPWRRACEIRRILTGNTTPATKQTGHVTPPPPAQACHATCSTGTPLAAGCNACGFEICAVDSFCCTQAWDSICVSEVTSVCHQTCP